MAVQLLLSIAFDFFDLIRGERLPAFIARIVAGLVVADASYVDALDAKGRVLTNREVVSPNSIALVAVVSDERLSTVTLLCAAHMPAMGTRRRWRGRS